MRTRKSFQSILVRRNFKLRYRISSNKERSTSAKNSEPDDFSSLHLLDVRERRNRKVDQKWSNLIYGFHINADRRLTVDEIDFVTSARLFRTTPRRRSEEQQGRSKPFLRNYRAKVITKITERSRHEIPKPNDLNSRLLNIRDKFRTPASEIETARREASLAESQ